MRLAIFIIAILATYGGAAQDNTTIEILPKQRKNEIGILGDMGLGNNNPMPHNSIQYKRWVKPDYMAYRVNIGYGKFTKYGNEIVYPSHGDTTFTQYSLSEVPQVNAGIGVEMQKHFTKKVYMYAAVDLYAAYGSGTTKDVLRKKVIDKNEVTIYEDLGTIKDYKSANLRVGAMPFVGVKMQFSRISFGTELSGIRMEYNSLKHNKTVPSNGGMMDFNMGDFTQRVFLNYRF